MRGKSCFFIGILLVLAISFASAINTVSLIAPTPLTGYSNSNSITINVTSDVENSIGVAIDLYDNATVATICGNVFMGVDNASQDCDVSSTLDGIYYIEAVVRNSSGFDYYSGRNYITLDRAGPTTTDNTGTFVGTQTGSVTVLLTCADAGVGCNTTLYCISNTGICVPDTAGTSVIIPATDGTYYITYQSNDTLGNVESSATTTSGISIAIPAPVVLQQASSSGVGSSSGGRSACIDTKNWDCTWGECINGVQTKISCTYPAGHCAPTIPEPKTQPCKSPSTTKEEKLPLTTNPPKVAKSFLGLGQVTGALGTTGSVALVIVVIVAVGVAYWLVRKNKIKKKDVANKVKWKGKKE